MVSMKSRRPATRRSRNAATAPCTPFTFIPRTSDFQKAASDDLKGGDAVTNAAIVRGSSTHARAPRDVVVSNAGAALFIAGPCRPSLQASPLRARRRFRGGARHLDRMVALSHAGVAAVAERARPAATIVAATERIKPQQARARSRSPLSEGGRRRRRRAVPVREPARAAGGIYVIAECKRRHPRAACSRPTTTRSRSRDTGPGGGRRRSPC